MYIYTLTCRLLFMLRSYMLCIFMFLFIQALPFSLYFPKRSRDQLSSLVWVKYKNYIRRNISPFWTSRENWNWLILDLNMSVLPIIIKHFPKNSSVILLKIPDTNNTSRIKFFYFTLKKLYWLKDWAKLLIENKLIISRAYYYINWSTNHSIHKFSWQLSYLSCCIL